MHKKKGRSDTFVDVFLKVHSSFYLHHCMHGRTRMYVIKTKSAYRYTEGWIEALSEVKPQNK